LCVVHESQDVRSAFEGWGAADYVSTDELCPHFPGQTVACDYGKWCAAEWLEGNAPKRPRNRRTWPKGTVEKVVATSVAVRWCTKGSNPAVLEEWVAPEEMEVLPWMWLDGWRLGDHVVPSNEAIRQLSAMPGWSDKVEISADLCGVVSRITSKLTVRWADGTVTQVPSLDVRPWRNTGGHEFLPHQLVALSENLQPDDSQPHRCRGVVRSANLEERTCDVYWLPCLNNQTTEPFLETNVSVYELTEHPDFDFLPGDTVLKLGGGASWLGVVEDVLADGTLQVDWDGTTEVAKMEDLLRVDDGAEEDDGYVDEEDEEDLDAGLSEGEEAQATGSGDEATTEASTERGDDEDLSADAEPQAAEPERVESVSAGPVSGIAPDEDDEVLGGLTAAPADHAFVAEPVEAVRIAVVRREMKAFQRGLPEDRSIFVRSFDDTPQLFRVCVIGPEKTPYADVPFVFDCWLPANYPNVPPKVLGKAVWGPERLNPNLYSDGKVCLSLLGTWDGPGWDKQNSTLLQVFLSIQALVLVENPYYNEPGYEQHKSSLDGERNSALYNENARLLSLHAACALAENPPRGLAKVLDTHFRSAGRRIVKTCEDIAQRPAEFGHSAGYSRCIARLLPRLRTSLIKDDASETEGLVSTQAPSGSSDSSVP